MYAGGGDIVEGVCCGGVCVECGVRRGVVAVSRGMCSGHSRATAHMGSVNGRLTCTHTRTELSSFYL